MGNIVKTAQAGTLESNDIMVTIAPGAPQSGVIIELDSIVLLQYGEAITDMIQKTIKEQSVQDVMVKAVDRGALDCTIRARTLTALARAGAVLKEAAL